MTTKENLKRQYLASIADEIVEEQYIRLFIEAVKACPHAIKAEIGASALAEEIIKGAVEFSSHISAPSS